MVKKVALNDVHEKLGAKMMPFAGYNMPIRYSSDLEEHKTVRNGVGVFDVSHMGEFIIKGPHALDLIQKVSSNDASKLTVGKAQYAYLPNDKGGIVDDLIVYKLANEEYMLVVNASNIKKDWEWISRHNDKHVEMENVSDEISLFAVQGPRATEVLQSLTPIDLKEMKPYTFKKGEFAEIPNVIVSATGYTGAGGFELYLSNEYAEEVWHKIFEAGKAFDIKPIGLGARDTLRLEMGYALYGNDIDETTSPLEAGLGWITKFDKDFINSDRLAQQKETGVDRKLIGFTLVDKGIPRQGYPIYNDKEERIGEVTSGTQSPCLGKGIGLGYVSKPYTTQDIEIFIGIRNKNVKAVVTKLPFYKS